MLLKNKRRIRVLVVDDSSTIRIAATKVFGEGFDVLIAIDGEDGLEVVENDPHVQVIFTDLVMPEMDGFELLKRLRTHKDKRISNLPIIVMTGAENPEIAKQKALNLGATDFITKPFNATDIRARALSYAKLSSATKELREKTTIDDLTGLLNAKGFHHQLDKEIAFATRHSYEISAIRVEIDNYKDLFISMGRRGTEQLIKRVSEIIAKGLRKEDTIARVGLAKFCVSMPLVSKNHAMEMEKGSHPKQLINAAQDALERAMALGKSQIYLLTVNDHTKDSKSDSKPVSIDELINQINKGDGHLVATKLNNAIDQLAPLMALLSHEQKQKILTHR